MRNCPFSVAAFWAGAAHPRRQKHREMPPPGASAPAFAATAEPALSPPHAKHPRQDASSTRDERVLGWVLGDVLEMGCFLQRFLISSPDLRIDASFSRFTLSFVHRFLISGPDLRIDAGFCLFTPSFVHRFLISGPDLRIDAGFCLFTPSFVHRFLISGPDLRIDAGFCLFTPSFVHRFLISGSNLRIDAGFSRFTLCCVHRFLISGPDLRIDARGEWFRLQRLSRQRSSASDSNHRRCKEEWLACRRQ